MTSGPYATQICDGLDTTPAELVSIRPVSGPANQASLRRARGAGRKGDGEAGTVPGPVALRREGPVVGLDNCAGDRQPET